VGDLISLRGLVGLCWVRGRRLGRGQALGGNDRCVWGMTMCACLGAWGWRGIGLVLECGVWARPLWLRFDVARLVLRGADGLGFSYPKNGGSP